jgi:hypothetical protein
MRELSGALVVIAGAIVFAASILAPSLQRSTELNTLSYIGLLVAGLLGLFGGLLILSSGPKTGKP